MYVCMYVWEVCMYVVKYDACTIYTHTFVSCVYRYLYVYVYKYISDIKCVNCVYD